MVKKSKVNKKILILLLIVLLLILGIGYAIFSDTLTIQGTVNAKGTFDLEFQNAELVKAQGVKEEETKVEIRENKNTLTVNVADLEYPGAGAEFTVDIVNVGTIPAKVQEIKQTNITGSGSIKVRGLEVINEEHPTIEPEDKCNIHFVVELSKDAIEIEENESITFGLEIEYIQGTGETFTGNTAHIDGKIKEIPEYTVPTGLKATYGETLADVELPEGFSFQDSLETSVGELGTNTFKVTYTPIDTEKYNVIIDIEITIEVEELKQKEGDLVEIIKGKDYGKTINYSTTVQGEIVDNWKVFLNDGKNVYIILDGYMPNRLLPEATGLQKSTTYNIYSSKDREALLKGLTTESYWSEFAGGVKGALATGSPTYTQLVESWNANPNVNSETLEVDIIYSGLNDTTKLYIPNKATNCHGYWLASNYIEKYNFVWMVGTNGSYINSYIYNHIYFSNRPVVCLPTNLRGTVGDTVEI